MNYWLWGIGCLAIIPWGAFIPHGLVLQAFFFGICVANSVNVLMGYRRP